MKHSWQQQVGDSSTTLDTSLHQPSLHELEDQERRWAAETLHSHTRCMGYV